MKRRPAPQLALRFDRGSFRGSDERWRDGASVAYLGTTILIQLDTQVSETALVDANLHVPLPPAATARQVQDAVESWLRRQAVTVLTDLVGVACEQTRTKVPSIGLSFAERADWARVSYETAGLQSKAAASQGAPAGQSELRFHWRLIEQPLPVLRQLVRAAVAKLPGSSATADLFADRG